MRNYCFIAFMFLSGCGKEATCGELCVKLEQCGGIKAPEGKNPLLHCAHVCAADGDGDQRTNAALDCDTDQSCADWAACIADASTK